MAQNLENWSQRSQRMSDGALSGDMFTDQHGRQWHAEVEISTNAPCSPFTPIAFDPPLDPPRHYMKYVRGVRTRNPDGTITRKPHDIEIDYATWIADWRNASRDFDQRATKLAVQLHADTWNPKEGFPPDVLAIMGPRPGAKVDAVVAASQGHPYVLGLRPYDATNPTDVTLRGLLAPEVVRNEVNWLAHEPAASDPEPRKKPATAASR